MYKVFIIKSLIGLVIFTSSCTKEKPTTGNYYATFNYNVPQGITKSADIEITESSKNNIAINGSVLNKNGKKIEGTITNLTFSPFGVHINGEWSHKVFSKNYLIKGTFTETYSQGANQYQSSGTFEIKSK
jgi:hypothetical protein